MEDKMRILRKSVSILLSVVMIVSIFTVIPIVEKVQAAQTPSKLTAYPGYDNLNSHWDKEWMSYIPDDAKLNILSGRRSIIIWSKCLTGFATLICESVRMTESSPCVTALSTSTEWAAKD